MNRTTLYATSLLLLFIASSQSLAGTEQEKHEASQEKFQTSNTKAYDIMADSERRDTGWTDNTAQMQMIIRRKDGREVIREVNMQSMEGENGQDKNLLLFNKPLDVKGTVFLTHSFPLKQDHQWIYLPSQKRVKRISSKRRTGRFMGSEFTFEDMSAFSLEKNTYQYLGETSCGEPIQDCHIIEMRPKDKYSAYEKVISYIDKQELRGWKTEFYSKRTGKMSKTLTINNYKHYLDQYWRPDELIMKNKNSGSITTLKWINQQFKTDLDEGEFRKAALDRRQ